MSEIELPDRLNAAAVLVDEHLAHGRGSKPAILCGPRTITYRDLFESVNRVGNALIGLGVRMEERVAMILPDSPECAFVFFGAMKIGAVAIPLNTLLLPRDYEYVLNDSRAQVLVVDQAHLKAVAEVRHNLKYLKHVVVVGRQCDGCLSWDALLQDASAELGPADTSKDDSAFWLYSSGTTGFPKGAVHLHHDMFIQADTYAKQVLGLRESDVSFSVAKLFFAYGLGNGLYFPLRTGGTTVLLPDRPLPDTVFDVVDRYGVTVFYSVPTSYAALLHAAEKADRTGLGTVRMCISAGEPLPKPIYEQWQARFGLEILDGIGSTEILHIFISNRPGQSKAGSTGQVVPGYEAKILDDDQKELPVGQVGTLFIKGDSIAAGYWNKHEQTRSTFHGEWINTRDKFRVDADGFFWYAGRTDDMIKVSGQAVWPADVEALLKGHPAVLESGVVGMTDEDGLVKPCAFVVLKDGIQRTPELEHELQQFVKTNTAPHKYPRRVVFIDALPKTATGKIQRYKLSEVAAAMVRLHPHPRTY